MFNHSSIIVDAGWHLHDFPNHVPSGQAPACPARNRKGRVDGTDRALRRHAQVRGSRPILGDDGAPFSGHSRLISVVHVSIDSATLHTLPSYVPLSPFPLLSYPLTFRV